MFHFVFQRIFTMKILAVLIFVFLFVQTLGQKNLSRRSGPPQQGPPRRPNRPPNRPTQKREDTTEKGVGLGWNGPLTYKTTDCVDPSRIVSADYDADFFSRMRHWYNTGDTKYYYMMNARILLGHYPQSQEELNQICITQLYSFNDPVTFVNGYGVQFQQYCRTNENGIYECLTNTNPSTYDGKLGVDIFSAFVSHRDYLVATDNKTYSIYYVCVDGLHATIQLNTPGRYASPEAVAVFAEQAKKYGIPPDQLQMLKCDSAYHNSYPAPFENYPNGGWSSGNGWATNSTGWGWGPTPSNGWNQTPPSNGWNSNPRPNGWSNTHNNGWFVEKQAEGKKESEKEAQTKSKS